MPSLFTRPASPPPRVKTPVEDTKYPSLPLPPRARSLRDAKSCGDLKSSSSRRTFSTPTTPTRPLVSPASSTFSTSSSFSSSSSSSRQRSSSRYRSPPPSPSRRREPPPPVPPIPQFLVQMQPVALAKRASAAALRKTGGQSAQPNATDSCSRYLSPSVSLHDQVHRGRPSAVVN
ncbi:hypothetical protein PM082_005595 [Marasmius tenuissimus]|nr:hypothetical protein PM082_005595 [Marasmius tenuissimus]